MNQAQSQFDQEYKLALRKQAEEEKQNTIANQISAAKAASAGRRSGSSGGSTPGTLSERKAASTSSYIQAGLERYRREASAGSQRPMYEALHFLLADDEMVNRAIRQGINIKTAVNYLLQTQGYDAQMYFNTPTGSILKGKYEYLTKDTIEEEEWDI
jgi:hypothetical protein